MTANGVVSSIGAALKQTGLWWNLVLAAAALAVVVFVVAVAGGVAEAKSKPTYTPGFYAAQTDYSDQPGYVYNVKPHEVKVAEGSVTYEKQGPDYVAPPTGWQDPGDGGDTDPGTPTPI